MNHLCHINDMDSVDNKPDHGLMRPPGGEKPTNPKDMIATAKLPLHLVPDTLPAYAALALAEGAAKYGAYNWRVAGVRASVYLSACGRHIGKWKNGENVDPKTGVHHLANAVACLAIILDAELAGKLNDDRPPSVPYGKLVDDMEAKVRRVLDMAKDKSPRHFTIADTDLSQENLR